MVHGRSDWVFGPDDRDDPDRVASGWASAARDMATLADCRDRRLADAAATLVSRRTFIDPRRSRRLVRAAERDALSRQIAIEQHVVVDLVHAHGHARRLVRALDRRQRDSRDRPAPKMIGATITCSRSRQRAARKRDTVSAPPSIRIAAHAARAQVRQQSPTARSGRRCAGRAMISTPAGGVAARPLDRDQQAANAVIGEQPRIASKTSVRIDDDARRAAAPTLAGPSTADRRRSPCRRRRRCVHQRPQPMQMLDARRAN